MSKPRIAAWIAGSALLLSSGVALAQEAMPEDPEIVETTELDTTGSEVLEPDDVVADVEHDVESEDVETGEGEDGEGEDGEGEGTNERDNHGAVVSEAAKNHEFDEACGNHGAYVSEVAKGGDPEAPECAEEDEDGTEAESTEESDSVETARGKSADAKVKAGGARGKAAKSGK